MAKPSILSRVGTTCMARWMALDVGEARIGVAISDGTGFLASPYTTLHVSRDEEKTRASIQHLIDETEAEGLVVGLPISLDGQLHAQAERVKTFSARLQASIGVPLIFWDERFSTVEAQRLLAQRGQRAYGKTGQAKRRQSQKRRRSGQEIDAVAATIILQEYLDHLSQDPPAESRE